MCSLWFDLRYGLRVLVKNHGFTSVVVAAPAPGIGANSAIFSIVNAMLLRHLPFRDADRLVKLWETEPQLNKAPVLGRDFLDWREQTFLLKKKFREETASVYFDLCMCRKEFDELHRYDFLENPSRISAVSDVFNELSDLAANGGGSCFLACHAKDSHITRQTL